jgi:hypothetical protein
MSLLEFNNLSPKRSGSRKPFKLVLGISALVGTIALGSTLAASINLNSGGPVEFGQGVTQTVACDADGITFTPTYKFMNNIDVPDFVFNGFSLDGVSDVCEGKKFTVKVYDKLTNTPINPVQPFSPRNKITLFFNGEGWHTVNQQCPAMIRSVLSENANSVEISFTSCFALTDYSRLVNEGSLQSTKRTTTFTLESNDLDVAQINIYQPEPEFQPFGITYNLRNGSGGGSAYWTSVGQWGQTEHFFELSEVTTFRLTLQISNEQLANAVDGVSSSQIASLTGTTSCIYRGVVSAGSNFPDGNYLGFRPLFASEYYDCSFTENDDLTLTHII